MKSTQQMQQEMKKRLDVLQARFDKITKTVDSLNAKRTQTHQEIIRLTSAIDALNGTTSNTISGLDAKGLQQMEENRAKLDSIRSQLTQVESGVPKEIRDALAQDPASPEPAPPGFRWGKNSFGEDALIPDGLVLPPSLEEPITIAQHLKIPPASPIVLPSAAFDRPEDLL